jgi:hypothetical protein
MNAPGRLGKYPYGIIAEQLAVARDYLDHLAGRLAACEFAVSREAGVGDLAPTIDAVSRGRGAAPVAMTTHGRTGIDRLLP